MKLLMNYLKLLKNTKFLFFIILFWNTFNIKAQDEILYCNENLNFACYILSDNYRIATDYKEVYLLNKHNLIIDTLNIDIYNNAIQSLQVIDSSNFSVSYLTFSMQINIQDNHFRIISTVSYFNDEFTNKFGSVYKIKNDKKGRMGIFSVYENYAFVYKGNAIHIIDLKNNKIYKIFETNKHFSPFVYEYPLLVFKPHNIYINSVNENKIYKFSLDEKKITSIQLPKKKANEKWFFTYDMNPKNDYYIKKTKEDYQIYNQKNNKLIYIASYQNFIQIYDNRVLVFDVFKEEKKTIFCTFLKPLKMEIHKGLQYTLPTIDVK